MESQSQGLSQSLVGVTLRDTSKGALCMAHALLGFKAIVIPPPPPTHHREVSAPAHAAVPQIQTVC